MSFIKEKQTLCVAVTIMGKCFEFGYFYWIVVDAINSQHKDQSQ